MKTDERITPIIRALLELRLKYYKIAAKTAAEDGSGWSAAGVHGTSMKAAQDINAILVDAGITNPIVYKPETFRSHPTDVVNHTKRVVAECIAENDVLLNGTNAPPDPVAPANRKRRDGAA